jgi:transposase-like protein
VSKRIEWTDEARAAVYVQWIANEKNIRRTAKDVGVPVSTLSYWIKDWKENGPPEALEGKISSNAYEFVHHASRVRESAMKKLEELIPQAEAKQLSAIATVVGIMDDKIRLASGLATRRTETTYVLPSKAEMKELMGSFVDTLITSAEDRSAVVIEGEVELEQPESSGLLQLKG